MFVPILWKQWSVSIPPSRKPQCLTF